MPSFVTSTHRKPRRAQATGRSFSHSVALLFPRPKRLRLGWAAESPG